ncbi:MAG: DUF4193 family protein [Acidimicrobiaceae bacterium]|jgi:hypothetical protein
MSDDGEDEVFDEGELADGFEEEIIEEGAEIEDGDVLAVDEDSDEEDEAVIEEESAVPAVPEEIEDVADEADVELALDEVLAETIRRDTTPEDDDEAPTAEVDPTLDPSEILLPKQDDEFRCKSCRLLKKMSQLADKQKTLCRDCV